jgi:hypothetical protein
MMVAVMTVEVMIPEAHSLKDKRRVILGLKQKLRNRFNVSVAEIGNADAARRCRLGIAMISNESRPMHSQLDKIVDLVRQTAGLTLLTYERELL